MSTIVTGLTNGVSFGYKHTVTTTDASDGYVTINFQTTVSLAYQVMILTASTGAQKVLTGALITEPGTGQIKIANGGSYTLVAGDVIHISAVPNSSVYTYEDRT